MKNYVVRVLRYFRDLEEKKERFIGNEFETTKERYEYLKSKDAVELVKTIDEIVDEIIESPAVLEMTEEKADELVEEIITKKKRTSKKINKG